MMYQPLKKLRVLAGTLLILVVGSGCGGNTNPTPADTEVNVCNSTTGLTKAVEACTLTNKCTRLARELSDQGITEITEPSVMPNCSTFNSPDHSIYDDGPASTVTDIDGITRYYCSFRPASAVDTPLVIFMHPGGQGNAADVYRFTNLRKKAIDYPLAQGVQGFTLVSIQGRNVHYPTVDPRDGNHHDFYFRDSGSPSKNPDIANVDAIIDKMVAEGGIDATRIYMVGWSNGALFSHMYSIARHETATPGGNNIAASATFSGGDPFDAIDIEGGDSQSCKLDPYPQSNVPQFTVRRNCDAAVACNDTQQTWFQTPPGHNTTQWLDRGAQLSGLSILTSITIDGRGVLVGSNSCATNKHQCTDVYGASIAPECQLIQPTYDLDKCANTGGILNHARWPDGTRDNSGNDYEVDMLDFLSLYTSL